MIILFTDTDTDFTPVEAGKYGYKLISMPYIIGDKEIKPYEDFKYFESKTFYDDLRNGVFPKTCALNSEDYKRYFEEELKNGNDILYVHFSKNMSGTFNAMEIAIDELKQDYPDRTIYTIDTKGITILSYLILEEIGELYKQGKSVDEIMVWAKENVDHYATYFFSDSLKFFALSGRISNFTSFFGDLIGVKPIIYMDKDGKLTSLTKVKGKKKAYLKLLEYFDDLAIDIYDHKIAIGHTDDIETAKTLGEMLIDKYGDNLNIEYVMVNPTAGSHCGPNTVGFAFYAMHK